jgi:hypothetical protein
VDVQMNEVRGHAARPTGVLPGKSLERHTQQGALVG